jgi:site-specific DNA-methyltransferase (adenine-specific)
MFPPSMPHIFIRWLTNPGDIVYDPFSGRGTTALESCLLGRQGLGSDLNPLAVLLTAAKVDPPTANLLARRLDELEDAMRPVPVTEQPEHVRAIFSERTLGQLLWLRAHLDRNDRVDRFLLAVLVGILHLNASSSGTPRGLSVAMPNTFSMAPGYVMRFIEENGLRAPEVDPVLLLRARIKDLGPSLNLPVRGRGWTQDALARNRRLESKPAKLVFTSPPYLQVMKYGKLNWIRLWMLNEEPRRVDEQLLATSSLSKYLSFMAGSIKRMATAIEPDGWVVLVIGDVRSGEGDIPLAEHVAESCVEGSGLRTVELLEDVLPSEQKVSRIWGESRGNATKIDRLLILGGPDAPALPSVPRGAWDEVSLDVTGTG